MKRSAIACLFLAATVLGAGCGAETSNDGTEILREDTSDTADVRLITCHINSVLRENLEGRTPFELMDSKDEKKLLSALNLSPIPPDEVNLSPRLLKH